MYINKMVFIEREDITDNDFNSLKDSNVISFTDYDTYEILSDAVMDIKDKDLLEVLENSIGSDVVDLLKKGEIDFAQVV